MADRGGKDQYGTPAGTRRAPPRRQGKTSGTTVA